MAKPDRIRVVHPISDEIRTQQSMKDEANIDSIIKRWRDGVPIPQNHRNPTYGDFSNMTDFHAEMNRVDDAREEFMRLPSEVRRECEQDVGVFLDKVHTEEGLKTLVELGLDGEYAPPGVEAPKDREVEKPKEEEV